jgi:hypothetical protein
MNSNENNMNKIFTINLKSRLNLLIILLIASSNAFAQQYNTLYWMQGIPQSSYSNPGLQPQAGFYLGLPGVSSNYFGLINSGFAPKDILKKDASGFLYIDDDGFLSKLDDRNYLLGELQLDLFGLGFRSGNDYFSLNVTHKVNGRMGYPGDLMTLLLKGNDHFMQQNIPADITGLGIDFMQYHEIGLGYSRKWTDELTAGLRAKALMGLASVNFERSDLSLITQPDTYALLLNSDFMVNKSFPMQLSPLDSLGKEGYGPDSDDIDPLEFALNRQNMGFAIDLGASYVINDYFTVAASMIDLGFINWKADVENFAMKGEFEFNGIEFNDFFKRREDDDDYNPFEGLMDSILDIFDINETMNSYRTALTTKVFASVAFQPARAHKFGLLGRGEFYNGNLYPSFTVSYNLQPIRHIGMSVSYSVIHWNYNNVGAGLHLNLGPLQIYTVVDNFWPALRPHTFQTATVHFGLNIVTGYRSKKDAAKPIVRW